MENEYSFSTYYETNEIITTSYVENGDSPQISSPIYRTGWMLSSIKTKNNKNIVFNYDPYPYTHGENLDVSQRIVSSKRSGV